MEKLQEESKRLKALAGIQEGDKKYLVNQIFSESNESKADDDFTVIKFNIEPVEPGPEDDNLYNLQ